MTPADRIRAAIEAEIQRSPAPPTTDDIASAVCEALAEAVVPHQDVPAPVFPKKPNPLDDALTLVHNRTMDIRSGILAIAADLRGEVRNG